MATRSQAVLFAQLIATLEPEIRRAFMISVTDLQSNVNWPALLAALSAQNTTAAIAALNISAAAWSAYSQAVTSAYAQSGAATAAQIVQTGVGDIGVRFNMSNPRAQEWIRRNVGESIVGFEREAREVARQVIEAGYSLGQGPRTIATDLAGRSTGGGNRTGGILGLDAPRAERLQNVTQGMRTAEGVRDLVTQHADGTLSVRYKVNKATADRIIKAYREGSEVPAAAREISERQYSNSLLKARADTVGETETGNAVLGARNEEWAQLAESQGLDTGAIIKTWVHGRGAGGQSRPDHVAMNNVSVRGLNTPFVFPDGVQMQYAHDLSGGAAHTIRCGCETRYRLDHSAGLT